MTEALIQEAAGSTSHMGGGSGRRWQLGRAGWAVVAVVALALVATWVGLQEDLPHAPASLRQLQRTWGAPGRGPAPAPELSPAAAQYPDVARACSAEYRASNAAAVHNGSAPVVFQWGCPGIPSCGGEPVERLVASYRQRQLGEVLEYVPCDLFRYIQGRTLWIVGDSQSQGFFKQLQCFLTPFLEKVPEGREPRKFANLTDDPQQAKIIRQRMFIGQPPNRDPFWEGGKPGANYCCGVEMPWCMYMVGGTRLCHVRVNRGLHLIEHYLPNLHLMNVSKSDIFVLNFGLWHHKREGDYPKLVQRLADFYVHNRTLLPDITIWRDNSPQHFNIAHGEYPHPNEASKAFAGKPPGCVPLKDVLLLGDGTLWGTDEHVMRGGWRNIATEHIMRKSGMPYLDTWNETLPLWDMHTSKECTHFCSPGGYGIWVWRLWRLLRDLPQTAAGAVA